MKTYLAALAAVLLAASPASATLMVTLTDSFGGSFHCVDNNGSCDFDGSTSDLLTLHNTVGHFSVQGTISTSTSGLENLLSLVNFGATNTGVADDVLNMWVSDINFNGPVTGIAGSASILFSKAIGSGPSSLEFYADTNNAQGANQTNAPGVFLFGATQTPITDPESFLGNNFAAFVDADLFSMTEVAHINLKGGGSFTDFSQNMQSENVIPLPPAVFLLGTTLGGLGFLSRRKKKVIPA